MTLDAQSDQPQSQAKPPEAETGTEELRIALALNGGVSLAVWMGGCAVELDRVRRAAAEDPGDSIYAALCHCFGRRIEIDILTGTSAGGINGALLGAAIAKNGKLDASLVRKSWIELGDLGKILYGADVESPSALMDGDSFYTDLEAIFDEVLATGAETEDPRRPPSLDVTMTDVVGVERRFRDTWGGELIAREHKPRFKFRRREHFTAEALATAARTTASFPFAFDPWLVERGPKVIAGLRLSTYGVDGGLLDNAPIREALELIPSQVATATVRRYVCYINADPKPASEAKAPKKPTLTEVGGYVVNLPRQAPLVEHLYAIRDAVERPKRLGPIQAELLKVKIEVLEAVAERLFETYCERRKLESLEELLTEPGDANAMFDLLQEVGGNLPWIPRTWNPGRETREDKDGRPEPTWEWGTRPAQRALHLLLDLLRPAIAAQKDPRLRKKLLEKRLKIQQQIGRLEGTHKAVVGGGTDAGGPLPFDPARASEIVDEAAGRTTRQAADIREALLNAARIFRDLLLDPEVAELECFEDVFDSLFGEGQLEQEQFQQFLCRVLAIEVVRRAFAAEADVESSEPLNFVQLTPDAPSPLFTPDPLNLPFPASARQKLTGVGLGHFAGFYRRSWRANDFMWGRLDGAARIVDLLLDAPPADFGTGADLKPEERVAARSRELAEALTKAVGKEAKWLLEEVLPPQPKGKGERDLPDRLRDEIAKELQAAEEDENAEMPRTRALFQRMAQLEVLREELGHLRTESRTDHDLGAAAKPLELGGKEAEGDITAQIKAVRKIYKDHGSLPKELNDEAEAVSNLSLQTITHAGFVGLAAIRTTGLPLSKAPGLIRPPLLAIAGTVANFWTTRVVAALGFWVAALFIASQIATADPKASPALATILSPATLAGIAALLGIVGFVLVPTLRAVQNASRGWNAVYALGLLITGGGLAAGLALAFGKGFQVEDVILAPAAKEPSETVLWFVLFALGLASASHLPKGNLVGKVLSWLPGSARLPLMAAAFVTLGIVSGLNLHDVFDDSGWQKAVVIAAVLGAPVAAAFAVRILQFKPFSKVWEPFEAKVEKKADGDEEEAAANEGQ